MDCAGSNARKKGNRWGVRGKVGRAGMGRCGTAVCWDGGLDFGVPFLNQVAEIGRNGVKCINVENTL